MAGADVLHTATARDGSSNIMTLSWHKMIKFDPPLVGCVISDRNHSFGMPMTSKECVINIPTVEIAEKVTNRSKHIRVDVPNSTILTLVAQR